MDIVESSPEMGALINDISVGTAFKWRQWYYMKIEECSVERMGCQKVANAVSIDSGLLAHFEPTDPICLIPMRVVIEV